MGAKESERESWARNNIHNRIYFHSKSKLTIEKQIKSKLCAKFCAQTMQQHSTDIKFACVDNKFFVINFHLHIFLLVDFFFFMLIFFSFSLSLFFGMCVLLIFFCFPYDLNCVQHNRNHPLIGALHIVCYFGANVSISLSLAGAVEFWSFFISVWLVVKSSTGPSK